MTRQEEKQRLRRTIRELENQLSPRYLETSGRAIAAHLLAMPEYRAAGTVFCFVGFGREVEPDDDEVDLGLAELNAQKKTR